MCGILFQYKRGSVIDRDWFERGLTSIAHRGPDDAGVEIFQDAALGSRRLAIQDLSPNGHMPMRDPTGRYYIVFNGELYNFKEIRPQLEEFEFHSGGDTEVVLYSYIKWGVESLQKFRGMYAFFIYDTQEKVIFFARDRFGKKPILYYLTADEFIAGSEVKAILTLKPELAQLDETVLADVLAYRYPVDGKTGFEQIVSLPPGHYMYGRVDASIAIKPYWDPYSISENTSITHDEALGRTEALLEESVKYRLIADVPIGVFLSGGVDSSLVTALAAKNYSEKLQTYAVGYSASDPQSELSYARTIADRYSTEHHEIIVDLDTLNLPEEFDNYFNYIDRPVADPALFPSFLMARSVGRHIKVVLNGDGGDELFAGYPKVQDAVRIAQAMKLPKSLRELFFQLTWRFSPRYGFLTEGLKGSFNDAFLYRIGCFHPSIRNKYYVDLKSILKSEFYHNPVVYLDKILAGAPTPEKMAEWYDIKSYMPEDTLPKADFATMANSLEGRSPLLDQALAEFAFSLPYSLKVKDGHSKYVLKKIAEKYMPIEMIYQKKRGFAVPFERWFRNGLYGYLHDTLIGSHTFIGRYLNENVVKQLIKDNKTGVDYSNHLWILLTLEKWGQRWLHPTS